MTPVQIKRIKKWISALRSGKYKQARETLVSSDYKRHCCLGVACKITKDTTLADQFTLKYSTRFSDKGLNYYGLSAIQMEDLITLNDMENQNFKQIADYIEKNILKKKGKKNG